MDTDETGALPPSDAHVSPLQWPPPGLERLHGALWPTISAFALADLVFAVPLFLAIGRRQHFASFGAFGGAYWFPVVTSLVGTIFLLSAALRLARGLRAAGRGADLRYDRPTILLTWSDARHDHGDLLHGTGRFASLEPPARKVLRFLRIAAPIAYLGALAWIPAALTLVLLLAYFSTVNASTLWLVSLVPAALLGLAGWMMRAVEATLMRASSESAKAELVEQTRLEARRWQVRLNRAAIDLEARPAARAKPFRIAALVVLLFILAILPVALIVYATVVGPLAAHYSYVPSVTGSRYSVLPLGPLRVYALPADASITPAAAGAALRELVALGGQMRTADEQRTSSIMRGPTGGFQSDSIMKRAHEGRFDTDQRELMNRLSQHPAVVPLRVLAHAPTIDVFVASTVDSATLLERMNEAYWLRYSGVRAVIDAQIARAAYQLQRRELAAAEQTLRELISAGLNLTRDGTTRLAFSVGADMAAAGLRALSGFYKVVGRDLDAELADTRGRTRILNEQYEVWEPYDARGRLRNMSRVQVQHSLSRAALWESYFTLNDLAPCLNLRHAFFPRDSAFQSWKGKMRKALIRFPSDSLVLASLEQRASASMANGFARCPQRPHLREVMSGRRSN